MKHACHYFDCQCWSLSALKCLARILFYKKVVVGYKWLPSNVLSNIHNCVKWSITSKISKNTLWRQSALGSNYVPVFDKIPLICGFVIYRSILLLLLIVIELYIIILYIYVYTIILLLIVIELYIIILCIYIYYYTITNINWANIQFNTLTNGMHLININILMHKIIANLRCHFQSYHLC